MKPPVLVLHNQWCQQKGLGHSDAAKRLADTWNLHRAANPYGSLGKWFAAALADGHTDGVLYDSKRDAVVHQRHNEQYYTFVKIIPSTMSVCEAEVMLRIARALYDKGMRMADPDDKHGGKDVIQRATVEDQLMLARGLVSNVKWRVN